MTHSKPNAIVTALCVAAAFALLSSPAVQAQTQAQMDTQAARGSAKADVAMNAAYKKLMTVLNASQRARLRRTQRAWLIYRDGEAALSASPGEGGTMYPTLYSNALEGLTEDRARELKNDYKLVTL